LATEERLDFAVAAGGITAILLYLKEPIHGAVEKMHRMEIRAVMNFVLIAFIVLPLLPDVSYDSFGVLNPREIWMVVVMIAGISLAGYAIQRTAGEKSGALWIGTLGGLVSSTATTFTYSRRTKTESSSAFVTIALLVASTIAFLRVLAEVAAIAPGEMSSIAPPLGTMVGVMILLCLLAYRRSYNGQEKSELTAEDPFQLKVAIVFGFLYAVILYASAWLGEKFGTSGLYILAVVSGLIDVDAITISTAQLIRKDAISEANGWRVILIAALSNLAFKGAIVATFSRGSVRWKIPAYFCAAIAAGIAFIIYWPDHG
ncbi:MAG TPA: DUF4010 domain-containing protein, partial [Bdellovibrionales bacterium]|nr:DUF4010 domain-containing protein [Bdellovibrionales bacterium]